MCTTLQWKNLRTIVGINYINVIAQRSDDKFIQAKATFSSTDNTGEVLKKVKALIETLESSRNKPIEGSSLDASNSLTINRR